MDHTESKAMMEVVTYVFGWGGCPAACFGGDDGQCDKHEQFHQDFGHYILCGVCAEFFENLLRTNKKLEGRL